MTEIKANPHVNALGVILEARLDSKKGPIATIILQHGTLKQGQAFISGTSFGKVRALFNEHGKQIKKAEISQPIEILGFSDVPAAGDLFQVVKDIETAKTISAFRTSQIKRVESPRPESLTLDQLFEKIEEGDIKELSFVVRADVQGSVEVLLDILPNMSSDKINIKIIHAGTGNITESDVLLASTSHSIIISYNLKPSQKIIDFANEENIEIRSYSVIYHLTDDIKKAMKGLLEPSKKEVYLGRAEIRQVFNISKVGAIAGCYVKDGKITRNAEVRVIRNGDIIHKGRISSLKHLKENVTEIKKDYECGISIEKFKDIEEGDIIEAYVIEKTKST